MIAKIAAKKVQRSLQSYGHSPAIVATTVAEIDSTIVALVAIMWKPVVVSSAAIAAIIWKPVLAQISLLRGSTV